MGYVSADLGAFNKLVKNVVNDIKIENMGSPMNTLTQYLLKIPTTILLYTHVTSPILLG